MRLIDADAMNEKLFYKEVGGKDSLITAECAFSMIKAQPTAYDVEKVVEEIEKLKNPYDADQWFSDKKIRKAQEIVRKGGAE